MKRLSNFELRELRVTPSRESNLISHGHISADTNRTALLPGLAEAFCCSSDGYFARRPVTPATAARPIQEAGPRAFKTARQREVVSQGVTQHVEAVLYCSHNTSSRVLMTLKLPVMTVNDV